MEDKKEKTIVEELVNSNTKIDESSFDSIFKSKEECNKLSNELDEFAKNHHPNHFIWKRNEGENILSKFCIMNIEEYIHTMNEFRLASRQAIIAENQRLIFLIRQEELLSIINDLQKKVDEYNEYAATHSNEEVGEHYTNSQLQEINIARSQSIPMYIIELETLSSAIRDNNHTYECTSESAFYFAKSLKKYVDSVLNNIDDKSDGTN